MNKKEFENCYQLYLNKIRLKCSTKNFEDFCYLHNNELDIYNEKFYKLFIDKIKEV